MSTVTKTALVVLAVVISVVLSVYASRMVIKRSTFSTAGIVGIISIELACWFGLLLLILHQSH
jgi:hypothetical protein